MGDEKMTMVQLAKLAGVSVSTVSKAFRDTDDISLETKEKIFNIAKECGCYGKFYKSSFHKKIFAVIYPELESTFYADYVRRLQKIIEQNGAIVLMSTDNFDPLKQAELIDFYASFLRVDGIFVISLKAELKRGYETPVVSLMSSVENADSINADMRRAMADAISLLKQNGHTDIAFLGERLTRSTAKKFCDICRIPYNSDNVIESKFRFQMAGQDGAKQLLRKKTKYTAIMCAYDDIAYGAIHYLKKQGISVPEDISIIGNNNINFSKFAETSLTTIDCNAENICLSAWELMAKKVKNKYYKGKNVIVPAKLVMRESVAKRKGEG